MLSYWTELSAVDSGDWHLVLISYTFPPHVVNLANKLTALILTQGGWTSNVNHLQKELKRDVKQHFFDDQMMMRSNVHLSYYQLLLIKRRDPTIL
jgi:hypothetical protein